MHKIILSSMLLAFGAVSPLSLAAEKIDMTQFYADFEEAKWREVTDSSKYGAIRAITEGLSENHDVKHIIIKSGLPDGEFWEKLAQLKSLTTLKLEYAGVGPKNVKGFANFFKRSNSLKFFEIVLSDDMNKATTDFFHAISESKSLEHLALKGSRYRDVNTGKAGGDIGRSLSKLSNLKSLEVKGFTFYGDFKKFASAFEVPSSLRILSLDSITHNSNEAEAWGILLGKLKGVKSLSLRRHRFDKFQNIGSIIGKALHKHPTLEYLNLYDNRFGDKEGAEIIKMLISLPKVKEVDIGRNNFQSDSGELIMDMMGAHPSLEEIGLRGQKIKAVSFLKTLEAIKNNPRIKKIIFEPMRDQSLKAAAEELAKSRKGLEIVFK